MDLPTRSAKQTKCQQQFRWWKYLCHFEKTNDSLVGYHMLELKMLLDYWAQEAVPLLCCWFASHLFKRVCCLYVCLSLEFLGSESTRLVKEECSHLELTFLLDLLNWGRHMSCRELQFISRQWQGRPEAPTTSLWGRAGFAVVSESWAHISSVPSVAGYSGYSAGCTKAQLQYTRYMWSACKLYEF